VAERRYDVPSTVERVAAEDLYGEDLTGRGERQIEYVDVDLTESRSSAGAVFEQCVFRDVRFNAAEHTGAAFLNCAFVNCSLFGARFVDCKFVGSSFDRCSFDQLVVQRGDWSFVGLGGADLRGASFTDVRMREVDLASAAATARRWSGSTCPAPTSPRPASCGPTCAAATCPRSTPRP
jgi:fluoroquinolone resistance protein